MANATDASTCRPSAPVTVLAVEAGPNNCALDEALHLLVKFSSTEALVDAKWQVAYECDVVELRKTVQVAEQLGSYDAGCSELRLTCNIPMSELPASALANVSLLKMSLMSSGGQILASVGIPTQVAENTDRYVRTLLSPPLPS
mmetsp:Transcript_33767/g.60321  ORF Transcript_33767/g.60321 Transcript_33767/m.60321 type:complete len:144 (-) Transcript_33767:283-714(-)|eukprot:CAMPEP_0177754242 /NCGR_PEP_ID=MMETSP0491_2-20121128/1904_1 /TAXON_ID=63592 /ORGANISM="Tetraselmis chuii, Strain PLY429" /LENGTH=143 /DNA_ID=CAMNT_0019269611 /DNA_START=131 /DNA_END=562 /DNA_ORIENTATION=-